MSEKQPITSQPENNHRTMGGYDQPPGSDYPLASTGADQNNSNLRRDSGRLLVPLDGNRDWSSSLFDCAQDPWNCLFVMFCTPCAMCQLASSMGECMCMPMCVPAATITMRTRLRTLGGIRGSICNDCLLTSVCGHCTLCQMKREMDLMGLVA